MPASWDDAETWCEQRGIRLAADVREHNSPDEFWRLAVAYDGLCVRYPSMRGALAEIVHDQAATGFSATEDIGQGRARVAFTPIDSTKFVDSPDTVPRTPLEAWTHELGHVYHNAHPGLVERVPLALARAGIDPHEVSLYATQNLAECFAEVFCLFHRSGRLSGVDESLAARLQVFWDGLGMGWVAKAKPAEPWRAVHRAADSHIARFVEPFLASVAAVRRRITLAQLEESAAKGEMTWELFDAIDQVKVAKGEFHLGVAVEGRAKLEKIAAQPHELATKVYSEIMVAAVQGQAAYVGGLYGPPAATIAGQFSIVSPFVLRAAETMTADLIRGVSGETKQAVRRIIFNATRDGIAPRDAARQIRQIIGLTTRQALAVNNLQKALLDGGMDFMASERQAGRYATRLLRDRALNIARTETMRAANRGQQLLWQELQNAGILPQGFSQRWLVTPDDRLCPRCAPMSGKEVQLGFLFRETESGVLPSKRVPVAGANVQGPPLHPRCRCTLVAVDDLE